MKRNKGEGGYWKTITQKILRVLHTRPLGGRMIVVDGEAKRVKILGAYCVIDTIHVRKGGGQGKSD